MAKLGQNIIGSTHYEPASWEEARWPALPGTRVSVQVGVGGPGLGTPQSNPLWGVDSSTTKAVFALSYDLNALERRARLQPEAPLKDITWFRAGGPAEILYSPADEADLAFLSTPPFRYNDEAGQSISFSMYKPEGIQPIVVKEPQILPEVYCQLDFGVPELLIWKRLLKSQNPNDDRTPVEMARSQKNSFAIKNFHPVTIGGIAFGFF